MTSHDPAAARRATQAVPSIPCDAEGPVFREPWEAQAFAVAVALHERGAYTWEEWAQALGAEIERARAAGDPDTGETYYRHWLAALERLVAEPRLRREMGRAGRQKVVAEFDLERTSRELLEVFERYLVAGPQLPEADAVDEGVG